MINTRALSSQDISELFKSIKYESRMKFYQAWGHYIKEREYLALDTTSISSYSELINGIAWGYNRDDENLPQINLSLLFGETSGLPVYSTTFNGSIKDVKTLNSVLFQVSQLLGEDKLRIVMDKGFCSTKNIKEMLSSNKDFIIAVPFTFKWAKKEKDKLARNAHRMERAEHLVTLGRDVVYGITKNFKFDEDKELYLHIYYNPFLAMQDRGELHRKVKILQQEAQKDFKNPALKNDFKRYLKLKGANITIKQKVLKKELENSGWLVIISNCESNVESVINIYRTKDVIEKAFNRIKNSLNFNRLRVHREDTMEGKILVGFLALIVISHIHKIMSSKNLYKDITIRELIRIMAELKILEIDGKTCLNPCTKRQNDLFEIFDVPLP